MTTTQNTEANIQPTTVRVSTAARIRNWLSAGFNSYADRSAAHLRYASTHAPVRPITLPF
ncbi:MAG TPA: hypothetical protein VFP89_06845 [Propionibacteriaceae bacterium]|nr:hypothetical protein [Propionibacteriaceae bacterium]